MSEQAPAPERSPWWRSRITRDSIRFVVGIVFLWHEVFVVDTAEPIIVAVGLGLCISPAASGLDKLVRRGLSGIVDDSKEDR